MYKAENATQVRFDDFNQGCGMQLDQANEWVILGDLLPWSELESGYSEQFPGKNGRVAYPFRLVLGSLIIQSRKGLADRKLVAEITENPYLQYFIGLPRFQHEQPFCSASLVSFRKRMSAGFIDQCNEKIIEALQAADEKAKADAPKKRGRRKAEEKPDENGNFGSDILDATCAPSYIRYPQDFSLLNEAREKLEGQIDWYCRTYGFETKPRTYRRVAKKEYLALAKCRKRTDKKIRATVRKMLGYVLRDLGYLEKYMTNGYAPNPKFTEMYLTILELYRQQKYMWDNKVHRVDDRIVSLSQPWIRPIIRGKAKAPTEFGAKFEVSIDEHGYARMEQGSFDAFNESENLRDALQRYHDRTGHWPKRVLADQIYRTRANREFCKEHGIRMSGPKLGRPARDPEQNHKEKEIEYQDNKDRIGIERFFSLGKRCSGMGLIMTKLPETTMTSISLSVLVTNLFRHGAVPAFFIFYFVNVEDARAPYLAVFEDENEGAA